MLPPQVVVFFSYGLPVLNNFQNLFVDGFRSFGLELCDLVFGREPVNRISSTNREPEDTGDNCKLGNHGAGVSIRASQPLVILSTVALSTPRKTVAARPTTPRTNATSFLFCKRFFVEPPFLNTDPAGLRRADDPVNKPAPCE